jgi:hypothetical protein
MISLSINHANLTIISERHLDMNSDVMIRGEDRREKCSKKGGRKESRNGGIYVGSFLRLNVQ